MILCFSTHTNTFESSWVAFHWNISPNNMNEVCGCCEAIVVGGTITIYLSDK